MWIIWDSETEEALCVDGDFHPPVGDEDGEVSNQAMIFSSFDEAVKHWVQSPVQTDSKCRLRAELMVQQVVHLGYNIVSGQ